MARAGNPNLFFSSERGENISLSSDLVEASWFLRQSGNYMYGSQSIKPGEHFTVEVEGSGHVDIGIVTVDPKNIKGDKRSPSFRRMNEVRVHKRGFSILMKLQDDEVISRYNDEEYKIKLDRDKSAWIAIYPKFGEICAVVKCLKTNETDTKRIQFSATTGCNIRLEENKQKALTVHKSPASVCFPSCKLKRQHTATFLCTPLSENDKPPSRFHVKILAYRENPKCLLETFRGTFDTSVRTTSDPPWTYVDLLERDKCTGNIAITLSSDGSVTYSTDAGHKKRMSLPFDASEGIWLIFELFRVSLRFTDESGPTNDAGSGASGEGQDQLVSERQKYDGMENLHLENINNVQHNLLVNSVPSIQHENGASSINVDLSLEINDLKLDISSIKNQMENVTKTIETVRQTSRTPEPVSPKTEAPISCPSRLNFRKNFSALVTDLNADDLIDYLFEQSIISKNLFENLRGMIKTQRREANRTLLVELLDKGIDRALFETILTKSEQAHLIPFFYPDDPRSP